MCEVKKKRYTKWTIELVEEECNKNNFKLLSTEYINAKTKIDYICSCGRKNSAVIQQIRDGRRCQGCLGERLSAHFREDYSTVKEEFERNGCILLSTTYINNLEKLEYICKCGNKSLICFSKFKSGQRCKRCAGNEKLNIDIIRERFFNCGVELLTTEYEQADQKFEYRCNCGEIDTTYQYNLSKNQICKNCYYLRLHEDRKFDYKNVQKIFDDAGCELLDTNYINNSAPLLYKCECGQESTISLASFQKGSRCSTCKIFKIKEGNKIPFDVVESYFKDNDCELLETNYSHTKDLLKFKCSCGNISEKSLSNFRKTPHCIKCNKKKQANTDPTYITIKSRKISGYPEWRLSVFNRDDFKCVVCNSNKNIVAHHLDGYHWCEERRIDITNGTTLCKEHHTEFHSRYGVKNNTENQFDDFLISYNKK